MSVIRIALAVVRPGSPQENSGLARRLKHLGADHLRQVENCFSIRGEHHESSAWSDYCGTAALRATLPG